LYFFAHLSAMPSWLRSRCFGFAVAAAGRASTASATIAATSTRSRLVNV
jgi:hypothetical protein